MAFGVHPAGQDIALMERLRQCEAQRTEFYKACRRVPCGVNCMALGSGKVLCSVPVRAQVPVVDPTEPAEDDDVEHLIERNIMDDDVLLIEPGLLADLERAAENCAEGPWQGGA